MPAEIELVVARYGEGLNWTRNVPRDLAVTIYNKGAEIDALPHARVHPLENIGYEAHTYLHHLVTRYDTLAPVTVFCQGHPFDHAHDLHRVLRALDAKEDTIEAFRWLGFIIDSDDPRGRRLFVPWSKNDDGRELDLDGFCRALFDAPAAPWTHFVVGAQFAVTRDQARTRNRAFYERALELAVGFPDGGSCFERLWDRVFDVVGVDPAVLGGELCRYLKPIRRLRETSPANR